MTEPDLMQAVNDYLRLRRALGYRRFSLKFLGRNCCKCLTGNAEASI